MRCAHCAAPKRLTFSDFWSPTGAFLCPQCEDRSFVGTNRFWCRVILIQFPAMSLLSFSMALRSRDELGNLGWIVCAVLTVFVPILIVILSRWQVESDKELQPYRRKRRKSLWVGVCTLSAVSLIAIPMILLSGENLAIRFAGTILWVLGNIVLMVCLIVAGVQSPIQTIRSRA